MIKIINIFLLFFVYTTFSMGFSTSFIDEQINGPYLNDPEIIYTPNSSLEKQLNRQRCNKKPLNKIYKTFNSYGFFENKMSDSDINNILVCSWKKNKKAYFLLEKIVYPDKLLNIKNYESVDSIIYNPIFILRVVNESPKILSVIPDSHPEYLNICLNILEKKPNSFQYITLRYKRHPHITSALFNIKKTYDDKYKHYAMQYTVSLKQQNKYVKHNGLLYRELPIEVRRDPYLTYYAYIQNGDIYSYIPKNVIDVFKSEKAIRTPRYMTKIVLIRQSIYRKISGVGNYIIQIFSRDDDEVTLTKTEISSEQLQKMKKLNQVTVVKEKTVVTNIKIINAIEQKKERRLLYLWRIARYGDERDVFVAMFRPIGKDYLGTIVIKQGNRYMFSDFSAVFSLDGKSIWRVNDKGLFSAAKFKLIMITKLDDEKLIFTFQWEGEGSNTVFNLTDDSGVLVKTFKEHVLD